MEIVMVKHCDLRTYEYHLNGTVVVAVFNHQNGIRHAMPFRTGRKRTVYSDRKGSYIKLDRHKHYLVDEQTD